MYNDIPRDHLQLLKDVLIGEIKMLKLHTELLITCLHGIISTISSFAPVFDMAKYCKFSSDTLSDKENFNFIIKPLN